MTRLSLRKKRGDVGRQGRKSSRPALGEYIDSRDLSDSTSRLLIWEGLRRYSIRALIPLLIEPEAEVRTAAARRLHILGGNTAWAAAKKLCESRNPRHKIMGLFVLGQLGTPRLPYKRKTLEIIDSMLSRRQPASVVEQALYSVGHLRQGKPLVEHRGLFARIEQLKARRGSKLAEAKAFALG